MSRLTYVKDTRTGLWATREEVGYYPCQAHYSAKVLNGAIRAHWDIEIRAHHVRDVTLGEDASCIRSLVLNIPRANGIRNISLAFYANTISFDHLLALGTA